MNLESNDIDIEEWKPELKILITDNLENESVKENLNEVNHCPKERDGPALGCKYCWNTTDENGRILKRKTRFHCPDCQTNLCIVPCFQAYHEALEKDKSEV